jgi:pyruvate formate-lyase/glycerol dehydratase family glycyl radical enzyme
VRERIQRLKEKLFSMDNRTMFLERLFLMKKGYEKYRDERPSVRYALILNEILANISVVIDEDDLIVGRIKETIPTAQEEESLKEIAEYYKSVCPEAMNSPKISVKDWANSEKKTDEEEFLSGVFFSSIASLSWFSTAGHITVAWDILLNKGMKGVRDLAQEKLVELDNDPESVKKRHFLEAVTISCDAVINFAKRYEEYLATLAKDEKDEGRRDDLLKVREVFKRVPAYPARSFHDALQSVWFLDLVMHTVCGARDYALGRMDQYLYDYYKRDIEQGRLTKDDAIELLQNVFIHTVEISGLGDQAHGSKAFGYTTTMPIKRSRCKDSVQYLILAGQTLDGRDACNELSYVILDAVDELRTKTPNITLRYHKGIDREFWLKACDLMRRRFNNIGVYNDDVMIGAFENCGVRFEDAMTYSHYGCCNPCIPGKDAQLREDQRNLAKILELTLNDGFDPVATVQRGPHTGRVDDFETFDDLMDAFKIQMRNDVARAVESKVRHYSKYVKERPFSFESCLLEGCVERAMDCNDPNRNPVFGGPGYIHHNIDAGGLATAADSLAAIKKLVYDDKEITLRELKKALDTNFGDHEMLRLRMLNKCPKFGNDDDYVDSLAREIGLAFCREVVSYDSKHPVLGQCWPQLYTYHRYRSCGLETGATPDGRRAWEPVSENQSPTNGCDRKGFSALINSLSKLRESFSLTPGGGVTVSMHPTTLMVEDGAKVIADTIETYFEMGGMHLQTNIVDKDTLIDAQNHPEKHRDLIVRVTGYSAYFVTLSPESQDNIITRFSHYS